MEKGEFKYLDGKNIVVQKYYMLPTPKIGEQTTYVYNAWRNISDYGIGYDGCSTITTFDHIWYGKIGSDPDKKLFDHLPVGKERSLMVHRAYQLRDIVAEKYIHEAFPETKELSCIGGEIVRYKIRKD